METNMTTNNFIECTGRQSSAWLLVVFLLMVELTAYGDTTVSLHLTERLLMVFILWQTSSLAISLKFLQSGLDFSIVPDKLPCIFSSYSI